MNSNSTNHDLIVLQNSYGDGVCLDKHGEPYTIKVFPKQRVFELLSFNSVNEAEYFAENENFSTMFPVVYTPEDQENIA